MNAGEMKEAFLAEAGEILSLLNNTLVRLEKDPGETGAVREIFRAAHTLKGMSAAMGYGPMASLTHEMESVLEPLRSGGKALAPSLVDALFACMDQLESWVGTLATRDTLTDSGLGTLLERLRKAAPAPPPSPASSQRTKRATSPSPQDAPFPRLSDLKSDILIRAIQDGLPVVKVVIELAEDCAFMGARAVMALRAIRETGEIVASRPSPAEIEKGAFPGSFHLLAVLKRPMPELEEALSKISEVNRVVLEPFTLPAGEVLPAGSAELVPASGADVTEGSTPPVGEKPFAVSTVRIQTAKLDRLMALAQELLIAKIRLEQVSASGGSPELRDSLSQLRHVTDDLQNEVLKTRLMPVRQVFERFPRVARDLAKLLGKDVRLETGGAEVELDRAILEEMGETLVHLVRNALDHGVEAPEERMRSGKPRQGVLRLEAKRERSYVLITVSDDGKGIDPAEVRRKCEAKGLITPEEASRMSDEDSIRLVALPGFSTRDEAGEISGRGVGLDAVKAKAEGLGGSLRIQSQKGAGTSLTLRFPLTLAILQVMLVKCGGETFGLPVTHIVETLDFRLEDKKSVQGRETLLLRGEVVPLYRLSELLEMEPSPASGAFPGMETALIGEVGEARVGLVVDEVLGQQEAALKPLTGMLMGIRGYAGATILGTGNIALILDLGGLLEDFREKRLQVRQV